MIRGITQITKTKREVTRETVGGSIGDVSEENSLSVILLDFALEHGNGCVVREIEVIEVQCIW